MSTETPKLAHRPILPEAAAAHASADEREGMRGLRATIDLAPVGIAHLGIDGSFLLVNDRLCAILGYSRRDLLQRRFQELTFPDDLEKCLALNRQLAAGTLPSYCLEKRFVRPDATPVWARVTVSAARDVSGAISFFIAVAEDTSEQHAADEARRAAEESLRTALAEAERATRMRDEMVAVVAHDLRNPVHTITMGAAAMLQGELAQEQRDRLLRIVQRTAGNMEHLLNDLLDVSRIDAGNFRIASAEVDVARLCEEASEMLEAHARERGVILEFPIPRRPLNLVGDRGRLMQVFSNVVGNALKFTPQGGCVSVTTREAGGFLEFSVEDTGPGVQPDQLARLFERFWRAEPASLEGAGLGLAIAKGIVEAHHGHIRAESVPGHGMTVRFSLPLRMK